MFLQCMVVVVVVDEEEDIAEAFLIQVKGLDL
jgi:hypothetical protein